MPDALIHNPFSKFVDVVLRGIAQVFFQNNPLTGVCILVGVFVSSWQAGLYVLLGTVVSTGSAMLLGVPSEQVDKGLFGLNGALTGVALELYLTHQPALPIYVILASIFVTIVTTFILDVLKPYKTPTLTSPFVFTSWMFIAALYGLGRLHGTPLLGSAHLPGQIAMSATALTVHQGILAFFQGIGQVMFQKNIWTGVAILVGLIINSRISFLAGAGGSFVGLLVAWAMGAPVAEISGGLYGFNPVLTAIALGGVFYVISAHTAIFTLIATVVTSIAYASIATVLAPIGIPVLTSAFVFVSLICLIGKESMPRLQRISPDKAGTPEANLKLARQGAGAGAD